MGNASLKGGNRPGREAGDGARKVRIGGRYLPLPGSRPGRILVGVALIFGGVLGFLPVVGFWMLPLGIVVLAVDIPAVRAFRRRFEVAVGRRLWRRRRTQGTPEP
jgi:hypothetical protein